MQFFKNLFQVQFAFDYYKKMFYNIFIMKNVDLHMHSLFSDGVMSMEELIKEAKEKDLAAISITDHDTAEGYKNFDIKNQGIEIITGTELLCTAGGCAIEILVYGFDYPIMAEFIKTNCPTREYESITKTEREIALLKNMGIDISFDTKNYDYSIPGAWIIRDFYNQLITDEKFKKVASAENPKLLEGDKPFLRWGINNINSKFFINMSDVCASLEDIRKFCNDNHCLMILAHPYEYGETMDYVLNIAKDYVDGIEIYHPTANAQGREYLRAFALKNNLMISGGSDYHGFRGQMNSEKVPEDVYKNILSRLKVETTI